MENLSINENEVASLAGIEHCPKLKKLSLEKNKLEKIDVVPKLPCLEELNLTANLIPNMEEVAKLDSLKNLKSLNLAENPVAEEKGDDLKKETLIVLDFKLKMFNGEEVTADDITEAKALKEERIEAEKARLAEEEAARKEAEAAAKEAEDNKEEA